jgi:PAS domain S-box-containing protein
MKQEKATLDAILNSIVDGVITIDHLGTIASFNNAAESLFGYSADERRRGRGQELEDAHAGPGSKQA